MAKSCKAPALVTQNPKQYIPSLLYIATSVLNVKAAVSGDLIYSQALEYVSKCVLERLKNMSSLFPGAISWIQVEFFSHTVLL